MGAVIGEVELVRAAHAGDPGSLGTLFAHYRPRLLAVALRQLGYGAQAEDAVHDAFLIALRRIDTLTDPSALRPWLEAIVRNVCRGYQRESRMKSLDAQPRGTDLASVLQDPEAHLDRLAMRDWVWKALHRLPESLRATVLLRHFGNYSSYEEISGELAIPVGTVRSRLSEARRQLMDTLTSLSQEPDYEERRSRESWNRYYVDSFEQIKRGRPEGFVGHFLPDMVMTYDRKVFRGRAKMELEIDGDIETGTVSDPVRLSTSGNVTVIDAKVTNPPDNPARCPVGFSIVVFRRGDRSPRANFYAGRRVPLPADWY
jgi:RNA polymerase sigma-70 factor (ECF subfamily)